MFIIEYEKEGKYHLYDTIYEGYCIANKTWVDSNSVRILNYEDSYFSRYIYLMLELSDLDTDLDTCKLLDSILKSGSYNISLNTFKSNALTFKFRNIFYFRRLLRLYLVGVTS